MALATLPPGFELESNLQTRPQPQGQVTTLPPGFELEPKPPPQEPGLTESFATGVLRTPIGRLMAKTPYIFTPEEKEEIQIRLSPEYQAPESLLGKVAMGAGGLAGQVPEFVVGAGLGAKLATKVVAPIAKRAITGAGMFALPAITEEGRQVIQEGKPVVEAGKEIAKGTATGATLGIAGGVVKPARRLIAQYVALTGTRPVIEQRLPTAEELILNGIFIAGFEGVNMGTRYIALRRGTTADNVMNEARAKAQAENKSIEQVIQEEAAQEYIKVARSPEGLNILGGPKVTLRKPQEIYTSLRSLLEKVGKPPGEPFQSRADRASYLNWIRGLKKQAKDIPFSPYTGKGAPVERPEAPTPAYGPPSIPEKLGEIPLPERKEIPSAKTQGPQGQEVIRPVETPTVVTPALEPAVATKERGLPLLRERPKGVYKKGEKPKVTYKEVAETVTKEQAVQEEMEDLARANAELQATENPVTRHLIQQEINAIKDNIKLFKEAPGSTVRLRRYQEVPLPPPPSALGIEPQPTATESVGATPSVDVKTSGAMALPRGEGVTPQPQLQAKPETLPPKLGLWTTTPASDIKPPTPPPSEQAPKITESIAKGDKPQTTRGKIYAKWAGFWNPFANLKQADQEAYLIERNKRFGAISVADREAKRFFDLTKKLSKEAREDIWKVGDGKKNITDLPEQYRAIAEGVIKTNEQFGQWLVDVKIITPEQYAQYKGHYVKYLYLRHILPESTVDGLMSGKLSLAEAKSRNPNLSPQEQKAMGLIQDIAIAQPYYIREAGSDIATARFFKFLADNPAFVWDKSFVEVPSVMKGKTQRVSVGELKEKLETYKKMIQEDPANLEIKARLNDLQAKWDKLTEGAKDVPEGFVQAPTGKSWGSLSGAFMRKEILEDLKPIFSIEQSHEILRGIMDMEAKGMAFFKIMKVALNLPTAVRNTFSNPIQMNMSGTSIPEVVRLTKKSIENMLHETPLYERAFTGGLFGKTMAHVEMRDVLNEVNKINPNKIESVFKGMGNLAQYYGKIDEVFKFAKYIEQVEKGVSSEKAVIEGLKWGMDYSLGSPLMKILRRHIIPFGTYQYKVLPLILESLKERPWVMAKYLAIAPLMALYVREKYDLSDQEWKKLVGELPDYIRNAETYMILPYKNDKGHWQWVNLQYFFPWGNVVQAIQHAKRREMGEALTDIGIGSNPFFQIAIAMKTGKDPFTKQPIYNQLDSPNDKMYKSLLYVYNQFAPSMFTPYGALGYTKTALTEEVDRYGRKVSPGQALGRYFGINIIEPSAVQTAKQRKAKAFELRSELARILKDPQSSTEKKKDAMKRYGGEIKRLGVNQ